MVLFSKFIFEVPVFHLIFCIFTVGERCGRLMIGILLNSSPLMTAEQINVRQFYFRLYIV